MPAWRGWYHVTTNTYGTWLPGDPRGWRERGHRRHVDGDYRNPPPPGTGEARHRRSRELLKQPPVRLDRDERPVAGRALVEMLAHQQVEVLALSVGAVHVHALARFADGKVGPRVGRAKKHAYHRLSEAGRRGKVWERSCGVKPIADRAHQLRVYRYILDHGQQGAWTWSLREGPYWLKEEDG